MFKASDTQFIITFQLALIGIAIIGSLFLIWKAISRVEEKLDSIIFEKKTNEFVFAFPSTEEEEPFKVPDEESVTVEEIISNCEDETLTRTKLRQMNLEKIKTICEEKGISTDGTKNQLIDTLLQN